MKQYINPLCNENKKYRSLCWYCQKAAGGMGCPWIDGMPSKMVEGAECLKGESQGRNIIVNCPEFIKDVPVKKDFKKALHHDAKKTATPLTLLGSRRYL